MEHNTPIKVVISIVLSAGMVLAAVKAPAKVLVGSTADGTFQGNIEYKHVEAPAAANPNNVVTAEQWAQFYPEIYASYEANGNNDYRTDYLEEDPYLVNVYEGYGFAKDYTSAIAHNYTIQDVANTQRPHPLANCLTCKTADFTALVNTMGTNAYSLAFDEVAANVSENVGCYTCHENQAGAGADNLVITHDYTAAALGDDLESGSIKPETLVCGQCHIEYYFNPEKATSVAYEDIAGMDPEAILAYYDKIGFSDWTQESTGTGLLKAQHPEMETFLGEGSKHAPLGLTCADCHMAKKVSDDGKLYTDHALVSPLESPEILATCAKCHGDTDMAKVVSSIQTSTVAREKEVGANLSALNDSLTEAVTSGKYTEEELHTIRGLYRSAQWFWDFDYVENSEGAHNSAMANRCLDKAQEYIDQANALFR